ncbi:MAG: DUF3572 domain-containing protein [Hyphomicrobiales bacterium]
MSKQTSMGSEEAQVIALKILTFLASDSGRLGNFLAACGLGPAELKSSANNPHFLAGVVDYLLSDESLLLAFTENCGLDPRAIVGVRRFLPGGGP